MSSLSGPFSWLSTEERADAPTNLLATNIRKVRELLQIKIRYPRDVGHRKSVHEKTQEVLNKLMDRGSRCVVIIITQY